MQETIFDVLYEKYKIDKPIRLIEFFAGYGSQALALKCLGVKFEHWKICEWAIKSIQAYKDIHFTNDDTDYFKKQNFEDDWLISWLYEKGISQNYNEPMSKEQIIRLGKEKRKTIYNNIMSTHNLVNIQQVKGKDLEIKETGDYTYLLTYSFPCQDLSNAGLKKGMSDTSTRSGMLWEVERILTECHKLGTLPQVLLMENVPQVHGEGNTQDFNKWQLRLEELGYKNYWEDLIATDYGIPQTRNRCFMVSILGDYNYKFPQAIPLKLKLKDLLECEVDEKYYLSDKQIKDIQNWNAYEKPLENMEKIDKSNISPTLTTRSGAYAAGMVLVKDTENYIEWEDGKNIQMNCRAWKDDKVVATLNTGGETKILENNNMKTELCNNLIKIGKVKENDVIRHNYTTSKDGNCIQSNNEVPTLDTRCDCLGVCVGTYQYSKSDKFMQGKDRFQPGKEVSDTLLTTPKEGVVINPLKGISGKSWQFEQQVFDENGCARTLKASEGSGNIPKVMTIGNYSPSNHNASRIVDKEYSAPTVMENHGTITAVQATNLRIRKLTPRECFRLMGVKDEDFENCAKNQSDASLYHLAGDSIVVNVLMAIFGEML